MRAKASTQPLDHFKRAREPRRGRQTRARPIFCRPSRPGSLFWVIQGLPARFARTGPWLPSRRAFGARSRYPRGAPAGYAFDAPAALAQAPGYLLAAPSALAPATLVARVRRSAMATFSARLRRYMSVRNATWLYRTARKKGWHEVPPRPTPPRKPPRESNWLPSSKLNCLRSSAPRLLIRQEPQRTDPCRCCRS